MSGMEQRREWGARRGRGKHGNQVGGARPGAGRKSAGRVQLGGRLGPEQIARAEAIAAAEGLSKAEVYRRVLYGVLPPLGPVTEPFKRQTIQFDQPTINAIRDRGVELWSEVRRIFSGDSKHL